MLPRSHFYLDRRDRRLLLVAARLAGNVALTLLRLWMGPLAYGSGFIVSLLIGDTMGLGHLDRDFAKLKHRAFMATPS
ncbi:MAG: exopolysaccharide Pel transporter PelG [Gammaproteobacteria bacterium]|nr:exopolysaccharide Pel transporter PelG [Gammaproteobacteria bacterium]